MNLQLHDILSNPVLLKDVSDETLQSWIQQYPYVSLFHLYALKNKKKYSETDLHKTAFYFNNREKLYFLLNDKQFESKTAQGYEKINTVPPPIEIKQVPEEEEKISFSTIEEKKEPVIEEEIITASEKETEVKHIEEVIEDTVNTEHTEQETTEIEELTAHDEIVLTENDIIIPVDNLSTEKPEITATTIPVMPVIVNDQPLSIADKILLEIQQLKEERARKEKQTEIVEEKIIEVPAVEVTDEIIKPAEEDKIIEEKLDETDEINTKAEETVEVPAEEKTLSIQEEVIARIQKIKEERELGLQEQYSVPEVTTEETKEDNSIPEITETEEEKTEETVITASETIIEGLSADKHEKPLSIQEEVIARIQKIKEERERRIAEENNIPPVVTEQTKEEIFVPEIIETTTEKESIIAEPITEIVIEEKQEEIAEIKKETKDLPAGKQEKVLSIQDEIIARIQQIKEERAQKLAGEDNLSTPAKEEEHETALSVEEIIEIPEATDETTSVEKQTETINEDEKAETTTDIKIVEKTTRPFFEVADEKNPLEEMFTVSSTEAYVKDIELIESKLLPEIEQEINDVDVLSEIHKPLQIAIPETEEIHAETSITDILPHPEEEDLFADRQGKTTLIETELAEASTEIDEEETESDQFADIFPAPLLVHVDSSQLKNEIIPVTIEQLQEETIVPIKDIVQNITVEPETVKEIIEEKLQEEIAEHTSLISKRSDLFIPNVEEDIIETVHEDKISEEDIQHSALNPEINSGQAIQFIKEEPHTFVEWLKLLDGSLQIQTTETPKETDNWIEIPRYEVEQAIAHKKEIQKEEQKLFEPNFEEGEVDLFNEIDEEVSKVASESVSFKQDMMTETLAKIYIKQGKNDKALEIYNTLLMKFPEKSAYFAALIQKIEKEK